MRRKDAVGSAVERRRRRHDRSKQRADESGSAIIFVCPRIAIAMEAERINQIAASLEDLRARTADLRRYL
jgi:hypothetical protein